MARNTMIAGQQIAPVWKRGIAHLVDCIVLIVLTIVLTVAWRTALLTKGAYLIRTMLPPVGACLYFILFHGRTGQTPGKMMVHIEVQRSDGSDITYAVATFRSIVDVGLSVLFIVVVAIALHRCDPEHWQSLSKRDQIGAVHSAFRSAFSTLKATGWLWYLAEVTSLLVTKTRRTIHDFIADTIVVDK